MRTRALLFMLLGAAWASAQPVPPPADWSDFVGSWRASYQDPVLGRVEGHVAVHGGAPDGALPVEVDVTLRHPETGAATRLAATHAERAGPLLKLTLRGVSPAGPSHAVPREPGGSRQLRPGNAPPLVYDANELLVPPRSLLTVRLRGTDLATTTATDDALVTPVAHDLFLEGRLEPGADVIVWRWRYPHPGLPPGIGGRRLGATIDAGKTILGEETWHRLTRDGIVSVTQEGAFTPAPDAGNGAELFATLVVRGFSLPVSENTAKAVIFVDPLVGLDEVVSTRPGSGRPTGTPAERQDEIRLRVRVGAGVASGAKNFTLNRMEGVWSLRLPEALPAVRLLARQPDGTFAATTTPCVGDTLRLEADFDDALPFDRRLARLRVAGESYGPLLFSRPADSRQPHLSEPFRIAPPGETAPADGGPAIVATGGDTVVLEGADSLEPVEWGTFNVLPPGARDQPTLVVRPDGLWSSDASLTDLSKDDRFSVMVRVPAAQAATLGDSVDVTLRVTGTDRTTTLPLQRRTSRDGAPVVVFAMRQPASFGAGVSRLLFFDTLEFDRSIMTVHDGETVAFTFGALTVPVKIHDTGLRKRLDVRRRQVAMLLAALNNVAAAPQLNAAERNRVLARSALLANALAIGSSPLLVGAEQVAVLEAYLNLVNEPDLTPINSVLRPYGATYLFHEEANAVYRAIKEDAREVIRNALLRASSEITIGLVEFVAERTGVGGIYTAVTGRTVRGQRVNYLQRILAAVDVLDQLFKATIRTQWGKDRFTSDWMAGADARRDGWRAAENKRRAAAEVVAIEDKARRLAGRLQVAGLDGEAARRAAERLYRQHPDLPAELAEAGLAAEGGMPAARYLQQAGLTPAEYAERLDFYYRIVDGIDDPAIRARLTRRAMGELTPPHVRAAAGADAPQPTRPRPDETVEGPAPGPLTPNTPIPEDPTAVADRLRNRRITLYERALDRTDAYAAAARERHNGRTDIDEFIETEVEATRRECELLGLSELETARAEARIRDRFARLHPLGDRVNAARGTRSLNDYDHLETMMNQGCTENEALVGLFWTERGGLPPQQLMRQLGLSTAEAERALDQYLLKSQHVNDPALRARLIREFLHDAPPPHVPPALPPRPGPPPPSPPVPVPPRPGPINFMPPSFSLPSVVGTPQEFERVGGLMRREWERIHLRRDVNKLPGMTNINANNAYKIGENARFPSTDADLRRYGETLGTIERSADGKTLTITRTIRRGTIVSSTRTTTIPIEQAPRDLQLQPGEIERYSYTNVSPAGG